MSNPKVRSGSKPRGRVALTYGLAVLIVGVIGLVTGALLLNKSVLNKVDGFERIAVSTSSGRVTFDHPGSYVAYYESDALTSTATKVPRIEVRLTSPSGRQIVPDAPFGGKSGGTTRKSLRYEFHGHKGVALWQFSVPEAGTYQVELGSNPAADPDAVIAFGKSVAGGLMAGMLTLLVGLFATFAGVILLIVGAVRRRRSRRVPPPATPKPPAPRAPERTHRPSWPEEIRLEQPPR
jgi:hypothetical protein